VAKPVLQGEVRQKKRRCCTVAQMRFCDLCSSSGSFKTLVRAGSQEGTITIRLRNKGADAYRFDDYGESITISRTLKKDGTTRYKTKSTKGRVISEKADEVKQICDAFNIQVFLYLSCFSYEEFRKRYRNKFSLSSHQ
jgi:hypothetical protein